MLKLNIPKKKGVLEIMKTVKIGRNKFYNVEALSGMLNIPVGTVRAYIRRKRIKAILIGKKYMISEESLQKFLDGEGDK